MTEQRKYDVDQIANSFTGNTLAPPEETSINNEKFRRPIINPGMQPQTPQQQPQSQQNPGVRYIKIENAEAKLDDAAIVDLTKKEDDSSLFERNIFSKLKKVDDSTVLSNLQNEVKELGAKVETINRDISKILDLLSNLK
jgi:chaperonin cofactor prefoldin